MQRQAIWNVREKLSYVYGRILLGRLTGACLLVAGQQAVRDQDEKPKCYSLVLLWDRERQSGRKQE